MLDMMQENELFKESLEKSVRIITRSRVYKTSSYIGDDNKELED
jgi:hypothetical protein